LLTLLAASTSAPAVLRYFKRHRLREVRGNFGPDGWFLVWFFGAGLVLNLLPIRWFVASGSFSYNLQPWLFVSFAVLAKGLLGAPRGVVVVLALVAAVWFAAVDVEFVRSQSILLPMSNSQLLTETPPLGPLLPVDLTGAPFQAPRGYYTNYRLKLEGGTVYFRDGHPRTFGTVAWIILALAGITLGAILPRIHHSEP
jgi:hypothetical protein